MYTMRWVWIDNEQVMNKDSKTHTTAGNSAPSQGRHSHHMCGVWCVVCGVCAAFIGTGEYGVFHFTTGE